MLDFVGHPGFAVRLAGMVKDVVVLDHHKTAQESLGSPQLRPINLSVTFDMTKCGATIARDHFKPQVGILLGALTGRF